MPVGTQDANSIPWDPNNTSFPSRKDLLRLPDAPEDAAWVWGKDDYCGRLNLLTPNRIRAASTYIKTGELIPMDLPTSIPATPAAGRLPFKHEIKTLAPGLAYDDIYALNTQSSTQWDGFRHVAHTGSRKFYNGVTAEDFAGSDVADLGKGSIHHWRDQIGGITGRGILLDYRSYADSLGLRYDSASRHSISYGELEACGKWQGIDIRPASQGGDSQVGDILFIRSGWVHDYYHRSEDENRALALRSIEETTFAGVKQEEKMVDWLHDCYFAAVAGDAPGFERWPTEEKWMLHEYLLALWGIPIGEMVDLERVSEVARREGRWTFFFTSAPFRTIGGIASFLNATAIF